MARTINTGKRGSGILQPGTYLLRCEDAEEKTAKESGNEYLNLQFSPIRDGKRFGPTIWEILVYVDTMQWKFDQLFDALDAPENIDVGPEWFVGKEVWAKVEVETDNKGEPRGRIRGYLTPEAAAARLAQASQAAASGGDDLLGEAPKPRTRKATKNQPAELEEETADMPF